MSSCRLKDGTTNDNLSPDIYGANFFFHLLKLYRISHQAVTVVKLIFGLELLKLGVCKLWSKC